MPEKKKSFGAHLRATREAKQFSLRGFAGKLGVSPTYLSHIEQGKTNSLPTADFARRAAELLGENPDEFIRLAGRVPDDLPEIIKSEHEMPALLRAAKGLTPAQLKLLTENARKLHTKGNAP